MRYLLRFVCVCALTVVPLVGCGENGGVGGSGGTAGTGGSPEVCGDGSVEGTEACDDMGESATCDADCTLAECGDGVLNMTAGEACDDGNTMDGDGCGATCLLPPEALFDGTYFYQALAGDFSAPDPSGYSWWGELTADGASEITGGTLEWNNGAGAIFSGPAPELFYTVDAARRMTWPGGGPFNVQGGISADGGVAALSTIGEVGWPGLAILVRQSGSFDLGSLNDDYSLVGFCSRGGNDFALWGTVTFDGLGGATQIRAANQNGTLVPSSSEPGQSYTVSADGTVTYTWDSGNAPFQGGILEGGDLVVLAGTTDPDAIASVPCLVVLVRQATEASPSTLSGNYHIGAFVADASAPPPHFSSFTGTASSDGVGTVTTNVGGTINVDGAVAPFPPAVTDDSYTVGPTGMLGVTLATTGLVGAVSPTGDYAVLAGGTTTNSVPQIWFLVR